MGPGEQMVRVPVFLLNGSLDAHITPGAGHDLNAFRSSPESFTAAMTWLSS